MFGFKKLMQCMYVIGICISTMASCTDDISDIFDYKEGQIIDSTDIIDLNKMLLDKTMDDDLSYNIEMIDWESNPKYYPWRDKLDSIVFDNLNGYSGSFVFNVTYSDGRMIEYWFARKKETNHYTFVYVGNADYTSFYVED